MDVHTSGYPSNPTLQCFVPKTISTTKRNIASMKQQKKIGLIIKNSSLNRFKIKSLYHIIQKRATKFTAFLNFQEIFLSIFSIAIKVSFSHLGQKAFHPLFLAHKTFFIISSK